PALVGTWEEDGGDATWTFSQSGEKGYDVVCVCDSEPETYAAHLFRLGKFRFLDVCPKSSDTQGDCSRMYFIPAHMAWRAWLDGDKLRLAILDGGRVEDMIKEKKTNIATDEIEGYGRVFTAHTPELRSFLLRNATDTKLFSEPGEYHRRK
ncbi:MAG TPA: hypothetical protein VFI02_00685, partial [Armatimonadota bacterium]|nr:hypothetical protein [Armatimonadota bacterium]